LFKASTTQHTPIPLQGDLILPIGSPRKNVGTVLKLVTFKNIARRRTRKEKFFSDSKFEKSSQDEGEACIPSLEAHPLDDVWSIDSGASFRKTCHRGWFSKYEEYNKKRGVLG
jgi:hypothetical protein